MSIIPHRCCTKCGIDKPLSAFSRSKAHRGGYHVHCKACYKAWWDANKERVHAKKRALYAADPEAARANDRAKYQRIRERKIAQRRESYYRNSEKMRARRRRYYWADPERGRSQGRQWYHQNKDKARMRAQKWRKSNRHIVRAAYHRYKSRKRANGGSFTGIQWQTLCAKYNHCCLCCGERRPLTVDHIIPVSKGGSSDISNIQPLCLECNDRKNNKTIDYRPEADRPKHKQESMF